MGFYRPLLDTASAAGKCFSPRSFQHRKSDSSISLGQASAGNGQFARSDSCAPYAALCRSRGDNIMGFELNVSVKRDPRERHRTDSTASKVSCIELTLNGTFDESAALAVLERVALLSRSGAGSIVVVMEEVVATDPVCLHHFAAKLMSLRSSEAHVQVFARDAALHANLASIATSRDWLLDNSADIGSGRRALHFDQSAD